MHLKSTRPALLLAALLMALPVAGQTPLGTAFTYQGRLTDAGSIASGSYDLQLRLFDAASAGSQIGSDVILANVLVTDGLFTVTPDFGSVFTGSKRWLEIGVRPAGGGAFTVLTPRQDLTPSPHTVFSALAGTVLAGAAVKSLNAQTDTVTLSGTNGLSASAAGGTVTITSNATPFNTAGTIVSRNVSGGFAATMMQFAPISGSQPSCAASADVGSVYFDADTDDLCVCRNDAGSFTFFAVFDGTAAGCD